MRVLSLVLFVLTAAATDWPQMGGPRGSHSTQDTALPPDWTGKDAQVAWRVKLTNINNPGQVAAAGGKVYLVDQNPLGDQARLRVLDLTNGQELWTCTWATPAGTTTQTKRPFGMPAVSADRVVVIGPVPPGQDNNADVRAFDPTTRQQAWLFANTAAGLDLAPQASPCLDGELVLYAAKDAKGDVLVALDLATGTLRWKLAAPFIDGFNGSLQNAPQAVVIDGVPQIVFHHTSGVCGVARDGTLLWNWDGYRRGTLTATPTVAPDGFIYVSSGHEGSCALFRVRRDGGTWTCATVFIDGEKGKNEVSESGKMPHLIYGNWNITSAAWWDGRFYAVGQKGLHCLTSDGAIAWTSGHRPPKLSPSTVAVNGAILTCLDGALVIARATPQRYEAVATVKISQHSTVSQIAVSDGRALLRCDDKVGSGLVCVDLRAGPVPDGGH